jgi:membrane glycosyltransferase
VELHYPQLRQTSAASQALEDYLARLPLSPEQRQDLAARAGAIGSGDPVADLHRVLAEASGRDAQPGAAAAQASVDARLRLMYPRAGTEPRARHRCRCAAHR